VNFSFIIVDGWGFSSTFEKRQLWKVTPLKLLGKQKRQTKEVFLSQLQLSRILAPAQVKQ